MWGISRVGSGFETVMVHININSGLDVDLSVYTRYQIPEFSLDVLPVKVTSVRASSHTEGCTYYLRYILYLIYLRTPYAISDLIIFTILVL